jgi:hypothetical protein
MPAYGQALTGRSLAAYQGRRYDEPAPVVSPTAHAFRTEARSIHQTASASGVTKLNAEVATKRRGRVACTDIGHLVPSADRSLPSAYRRRIVYPSGGAPAVVPPGSRCPALNLRPIHVSEDLRLVCVFNPALTGTETHDETGSFPPPER